MKTAQVFLKLLSLPAEQGIITLGQVIEASKKTPYAPYLSPYIFTLFYYGQKDIVNSPFLLEYDTK